MFRQRGDLPLSGRSVKSPPQTRRILFVGSWCSDYGFFSAHSSQSTQSTQLTRWLASTHHTPTLCRMACILANSCWQDRALWTFWRPGPTKRKKKSSAKGALRRKEKSAFSRPYFLFPRDSSYDFSSSIQTCRPTHEAPARRKKTKENMVFWVKTSILFLSVCNKARRIRHRKASLALARPWDSVKCGPNCPGFFYY